MKLKFSAVTPDRWDDLKALFGKNGACMGCWCMFYRLPFKEWKDRRGARNRNALRQLVKSGPVPGVIAYADETPIAWCCIGPREAFPVLDKHRVWAKVDDQPVWSVVCFFTERRHRRQGVTTSILKAAVEFARGQGARTIEGYPTEPSEKRADIFIWTGVASAFRRAGFRVVARRGRTLVMRRSLGSRSKGKL